MTLGDEALAARNALAAKYFPQEWAAVVGRDGASKKRQQLRQRAEAEQLLETLRARGACCESCRSFNTKPPFGVSAKAVCDADSDFHGYTEAVPNGLCIQFSQPVAQATATHQDSTSAATPPPPQNPAPKASIA